MFGNNPLRSISTDPQALHVEAMFVTIQGEGPQAGRRALFIRLAGCNLACTFCDTEFEKGMEREPQTPRQVMDEIMQRFPDVEQRRLVVLTGGEPFRQNFTDLAYMLEDEGTRLLQIETAGTLWQDGIRSLLYGTDAFDDPFIQIVCSPKTPRVHEDIAANCRHWKYIIQDGRTAEDDGLPTFGSQSATLDKMQRLYRPKMGYGNQIWVSPCDEYDFDKNKRNLAEVTRVALKYGHRVSLQMHKTLKVE